MNGLFDLENNEKYLRRLKEIKHQLVPFLGSGFSKPYCPAWGEFLGDFFKQLKKNKALLPGEIAEFKKLETSDSANRFEMMADFLVDKAEKQGFKEEMKRRMQVRVPMDKLKKFHLLHAAFPFLKITTNYDKLIETYVPNDVYVKSVYGTQAGELERLFTLRFEQNCLLKIHGGIEDMNSIVLGFGQYRKLYGHESRYDAGAKLPGFLKRVFTNAQVLFIGCSLENDRTIMIMEDLADMPLHFAVMKLPEKKKEKILLGRRMRRLGICTIWIENYDQVGEILAYLAEEPVGVSLPRLGAFVGREKELETMAAHMAGGGVQTITGRLYSIDGVGGVGKTALAIEAAQRFKDKFKDGVLPLFRADEHTPASFALELAKHLQVKLEEPPDAAAALQAVTLMLKNRHCLLILDNVEKWEDLRYMIPESTGAAVLVTTRNRDIYKRVRNSFPRLATAEIALEKFTEPEALALFRRMMGEEYCEKDETVYLEIARALGFLPIALRQAVSLMVYAPHYPALELRDKLAGQERLALLRKGCAEAESDSRVIETVFDLAAPRLTTGLKEALEVLAVCSPGPVPLDFLRRLDKTAGKNIVEHLERLYTYSWCDRREIAGQRYYELHQLVRDLARERGPLRFLDAFIGEVHDIFSDETVHFSVKERYYFQLEEAFAAAVQRKDPRLKDWLYKLYKFCTYRGFAHFYLRLTEAVEELFPGDQWAMRTVYGHRALILSGWGKLEEAMVSHKKQEKISGELGDRAGLSACYGNQALILKAWGKLDEAMTLHKKQEALCEELGDRAGLARSYGNQALILSDWGKLDEAMTLHKKEEALCEELGDRAGLARTWWNQGLIHKKKGDPHTQAQLWRKAIDTNKSMGIPTEEDEKELQDDVMSEG